VAAGGHAERKWREDPEDRRVVVRHGVVEGGGCWLIGVVEKSGLWRSFCARGAKDQSDLCGVLKRKS
jgi:hypothetical protein